MSDNNLAQEKFEEGMADFVSHNYGSSIDLLSQAIELDPRFTLALKSRGAAYLKLDKVQEAIADMNSVIEIAPDNARAFHMRGLAHDKNLHTKMGHTDKAAEDIRMVTHLSEVNIESFASENNVWRTQQMRLESMYNDDLAMER
jgi:tetratricopeptide (TPR) repeat protein